MSDLHNFVKLVGKLVKPSEAASTKVCFTTTGNGNFKLAAFCPDAILTMVVPKTGFINPFSTTLDALKPLAVSKKDADVTFEIQGKSVHVRYGVEQCWLPCNDKVNTLPSPPKQTTTNSKRLIDALASAARCTDPTNTKTALAGICLRGTQVLACTGVQLVALDGFTFPFKEEGVVCPVSKIFSAKELTTADTNEVIVGAVDGWAYFAVGVVELWLRAITDGKFPKVVGIMEPAKNETVLSIHPTDVTFTLDKLDKLLGGKEHESPVWLSVDKTVQVRGYERSQQCGIALELSRSTFTGEPVSVSLSRLFLKNLLQFGCLRVGIDPTGNKPIIATGDGATFVCMTLDNSTEPEVEPGRLEVVTSATQPTTPVSTPAKVDAVPVPVKRRRRKVTAAKPNAAKSTGKVALLEQVAQVRQGLRALLLETNELTRMLKVEKQQDRLIKTTMDSLRKLNLNIV